MILKHGVSAAFFAVETIAMVNASRASVPVLRLPDALSRTVENRYPPATLTMRTRNLPLVKLLY